MKQSLINDYLKALNTLVNDNRISFSITGNFADHCDIVAYWCNKQVIHNFTLFNDSSTVNYDNLINDYLAIMAKHPMKEGDKQLFSLNYDSVGYCSLAISYNSSNLELFGVRHKRISRKLAKHLYNYVIDDNNNVDLLAYRTNKYINSLDSNITLLFVL